MSTEPHFIILAAGKGTRLRGEVPKPLTVLAHGRTILEQQLENIESIYGHSALKRTQIIVGHRAEEIAEVAPKPVKLTYNPLYDSSNTAYSLLQGLNRAPKTTPVIWMNGDVVFSPLILGRALAFPDDSFMAVIPGTVHEEEMKYSLDSKGNIIRVSKKNSAGLGEAVGINQISTKNRSNFELALRNQPAQAYFEAAIEDTIRAGAQWLPLDTTGFPIVEVDFAEDLLEANKLFWESQPT